MREKRKRQGLCQLCDTHAVTCDNMLADMFNTVEVTVERNSPLIQLSVCMPK